MTASTQTTAKDAVPEAYAAAVDCLRKRDYDRAERHLENALNQNPDDVIALSLMADLYAMRNERMRAAYYAARTVNCGGDLNDRKKFLLFAGDIIYRKYEPDIAGAIRTCLETPEMEFEFASILWVSILLAMPFFNPVFLRIARRQILGRFLPWLKNPFYSIRDFRPLLYPYFLLGLRRMVVPAMPFENFMVTLRQFLLDYAERPHPDLSAEDYLSLTASVAQYCFHSDYIFDVTKDEQQKVDALRQRIEAGGNALPFASIALLACYMPLYRLKNAEAIGRQLADTGVLAEVAQEQITEYMALQRRARDVPALTPIDDAISAKVREQYEEFPYPRWIGLGERDLSWPAPRTATLSQSGVKVLIAGCGTGMESCRMAVDFPDADILAIDLTRASLAYAIERAEKYDIKNVAFGHADILKLGSLNRTFDYIQSFGVLHHMDDPEKGWAVLEGLLKPGGLMVIGLYSAAARRAMSEARAAIAKGDYPPTAEGMRRFRKDSPKLISKAALAMLSIAGDYYSLNMYRDLLFHVREDLFDIPRLKADLEKLNLKFEGFRLPSDIVERYRKAFPDDPEGLNLDHWHVFEQANPGTFKSCYTLLCRKPG